MDRLPHMEKIADAAKLSGLSRAFLKQLCDEGRIVHVKVGVKYLINMDRLADFLNNPDGEQTEVGKIRRIC